MTCLNVRSQNVEEAGFDSSRIRRDTTSQASSLTLALSEGERMWSGTVPNGSPEEVTGGFGSESKSEGSRAGILCRGTAKVWGTEREDMKGSERCQPVESAFFSFI